MPLKGHREPIPFTLPSTREGHGWDRIHRGHTATPEQVRTIMGS
jgi:hypothetical protein